MTRKSRDQGSGIRDQGGARRNLSSCATQTPRIPYPLTLIHDPSSENNASFPSLDAVGCTPARRLNTSSRRGAEHAKKSTLFSANFAPLREMNHTLTSLSSGVGSTMADALKSSSRKGAKAQRREIEYIAVDHAQRPTTASGKSTRAGLRRVAAMGTARDTLRAVARVKNNTHVKSRRPAIVAIGRCRANLGRGSRGITCRAQPDNDVIDRRILNDVPARHGDDSLNNRMSDERSEMKDVRTASLNPHRLSLIECALKPFRTGESI